MSAIDLPPGIGLLGTPLATFDAPPRARRLAGIAVVVVIVLLVLTWYLVSKNRWQRGTSTKVVLPVAFFLFTMLAYVIRRARLAITRDGVRWGWASLGFTQPRSKIAVAHVYRDGIALEAHKGSRWFIAARDWQRYDVIVKQLRRAELPIRDYEGTAPIRQRLQSYGRFLDALVIGSIVGAAAVSLWAA